jgi:hypothetical protein
LLQSGVVEEGSDGEGGDAKVDQSDVELVASLKTFSLTLSLAASQNKLECLFLAKFFLRKKARIYQSEVATVRISSGQMQKY